ncbi:hypothetical protein [Paraflavitalea sp. CAU 1676]|uniref:hypothetical protein n=1 Tax=Paraflavitalea sp. CAU 1676 TaxID=3032598 RepID=UPI0023D99B44|nr:hypothetical protein [Paraflavitalea sp. CAU 1676]MDF2192152.1 hypothetical protein [Paraflavitalea sp. CAU 1676]
MNNTLTPEQRDELHQLFSQRDFSFANAEARLVHHGYDEATAKQLVWAAYREHKNRIIDQIEERHHDTGGQGQKIVPYVVLMISVIGPLFGITSTAWYICVIAISALIGFWGVKPRPVAGLLGCGIFPMVYPFVHRLYFSGRIGFMKIELLLPVFIAAIPALLVYFVLARTMYADAED